jgi:Flp pilus assembly protein TadB
MEADPGRRRELAQQGRLWLLALVCATVGAAVVWRTDSVYVGTGAFLLTLAVLGPVLYLYERRARRAAGPEADGSRRRR